MEPFYMTRFITGDRVRFLDEKGEGLISRILDKHRALVRMDDGLEIPYLMTKLVPVSETTSDTQPVQKKIETNQPKKIQKTPIRKEHKEKYRTSKPSDKNNPNLFWEVDLHLEELVDRSRGMSNALMLDTQLRHFQKKLDEAISANIKRIVFIHGVGNGRLKLEIRKILSECQGLTFHDASYAKYGFGATEVEIR